MFVSHARQVSPSHFPLTHSNPGPHRCVGEQVVPGRPGTADWADVRVRRNANANRAKREAVANFIVDEAGERVSGSKIWECEESNVGARVSLRTVVGK